MTRQGLLQLVAGVSLAALAGRDAPRGDRDMRLYLGPGSYIIGEHGGIWVSNHGVRIEGCRFEGCDVQIADSTDAAIPPFST